MQVAKSIKLQMTSDRAFVVVKLDMKKIDALRLNINVYNIQEKIEQFFLKNKHKNFKKLVRNAI